MRSGARARLSRRVEDGAGLIPASGGLPAPTRTANGARCARPSAHIALPCSLRRTVVELARIHRLVFVPQFDDPGNWYSLPLLGAQSGRDGPSTRALFRAMRSLDVDLPAACTHVL